MKFNLLSLGVLFLGLSYIGAMFTAYCVSRVDLLLAFIIVEICSFTIMQTMLLTEYIKQRTEVKK